LRSTNELLRPGCSDEILERMQLENACFSERLQSDEVKDATTAFFQKRAR
jgi:enoyl-CoA hydratase/carnithine racemase